jgi:hypothetical protein
MQPGILAFMSTLIAAIAFAAVLFTQAATQNPLGPVRFMTGRCSGTGSGEPGKSTVEREYAAVLGGKFIHGKNTSTWAPTKETPKGKVHQDWSIFSHDRGRKRIVMRQFHLEGFVNQYVLEPASESAALVFVSEAIENIAPGWRARETYRKLSDDEFEEIFELAAPGKEFELYSKSRPRRVGP